MKIGENTKEVILSNLSNPIFTINTVNISNSNYVGLIKQSLKYQGLQHQRWNLKNLSRGLNPPKPGLN